MEILELALQHVIAPVLLTIVNNWFWWKMGKRAGSKKDEPPKPGGKRISVGGLATAGGLAGYLSTVL